ncbi:TonB-dependent receptor [Exilibacterium tricleocarpae]|uniref:TonB-dependent receptor n=1 Tax=Exilibacterium tricleocarpae TaxID=2591008 RepID=A0A545U721_9GAMM|nr:TonB-dependent receptor [Exilibacterium tricleocarpae]TQV85254.1 TonB-dependent receptor [Exilibacterium tricleocarpae]
MIRNAPTHWSKSIPLLTAAICLASNGVQAQDLLEEVVVTAQKREQNLQDVPVSVSAFTGAALTEAVIKDVFDLQTNVPGLTVGTSQSSTNTTFSIRGVGTSSQNFGLESSVGLYVDGAYRSRQNAMINNMVDIEAVEVLRGPQGTLFGKNTPSGAILFRTRAPSHETDGFVEVTAGNYGLVNVAGAASFSAIEDVLAFRVTGFSGQRDGFVSVDGFGDDVLNDRDRWGARLQALYTPSDDLSVRVIADFSEIDEVCCAALTRVSNLNLVSQDPSAPGIPGSDNLLRQLGGTIFPGGDFFDFRTALNDLPTSENEDRGLSVEVNWDRGDYTVTSLTSYRAFDSLDTIDSDFSNVDLFGTTNDAEQSSISQELRLSYAGDRMNYVVGAYYFTQDLDLDYSLFTNSQFDAFFSAGLPAAALQILNGLNELSANTGGLYAPAAEGAPGGTRFDHLAEQEHESWAIFGQLDYNLTDKLILTAGLRYTDEEKDLLTVFTEVGADGGPVPEVPDLLTTLGAAGAALQRIAADPLNPSQADLNAIAPLQTPGWGFNSIGVTTSPRPDVNPPTLSDEQVTGTLKLSYLANDDTMVYVSYGTGYKSGGTNTDRIDATFNPVFDAETSESFEVGIKTEFPDRGLRINAALYYTAIDDFQANSFTGNGFNLQNAGEIESSGGEIELYWAPTETVEVNLAYARINADFESFERGTCWVGFTWQTGVVDPGARAEGDPDFGSCDRSGDRVDGNSEDYLVVSGKKEFDLSNAISGYVLAEVTYSSEIILDGNQDPFKIQDDYERVNFRAGLRFDEYDIDLTLWGRNIFDEEVFGTTFDVPIQDGKLMSYPQEPRTYGLTLNKQF